MQRAEKLHAAGKYAQAQKLYRRILKSVPGDATVLRLLGMVERDRRNLPAALAWFKEARAANDAPDLAGEEGLTYLHMGQATAAIPLLEEAFEHDRANTNLALSLASALLVEGRAAAAAALLEPLAAHDDVLTLMAQAANASGVLPVPLQYARQLVHRDGTDPGAHAALATALRLNGDLQGALKSADAALSLDASHAEAIATKAEALESLGRREEAGDAIAASGDRPSFIVTVAAARIARAGGDADGALARIDAAMSRGDLAGAQIADLQIRRGQLLDDLGRHDEAWTAWEAANARHAGAFDLDAHHASVEAICSVNSGPMSTSASKRPIFIVGMFRSGTTLLEHVLAAHNQVTAGGEIDAILRMVNDTPWPACISEATAESLTHQAEGYLATLEERFGADSPRVTDKMPANYLHLGLVHHLFPNAALVHITRDPLDTCLSCFGNAFSAANAFTASLDTLAEVYGAYQRVMDHWRALLGHALIEVSYEALVSDPPSTIRGLLEAIGLPWDDACLAFHEAAHVAVTPSVDQVRRPFYTSSVGRWRNFQEHLAPLRARLSDASA